MAYQFHTDTDPEVMDQFVINSNQNTLFQCHEWASIKDNWDSVFTHVTNDDGEVVATALVLFRRLGAGKTLCYITRGPVMDWHSKELVLFTLNALKQLAKKHHAIVLRFDPNVVYKTYDIHEKDLDHDPMNEDVIETIQSFGAVHKGFTKRIEEATQPRYNVIMHMEEDWQNHLAKNTRQSIRTAEKRGAVAYEGPEYISHLASAIHKTETRQHVALRNEDYFRHMAEVYGEHALIMVAKLNFETELTKLRNDLSECEAALTKASSVKEETRLKKQMENDQKDIELYESWKQEEAQDEVVLCGKMVCFNEKRMEFFYMGNNTKYMRVRANYFLYAKCLERCAELHIPVCSFGGVEGTLDDGLTMFKSAWPVVIEEYIGEFNYVLDPLFYHLFETVYPKLLNLAVKLRTRN